MARHRILTDRDIQGLLLQRLALYCIACGLYFAIILIFTESMTEADQPLSEVLGRCLDEIMYWLPGIAILGPVIAYDMLRVSNRFTGPMYRLRREMRRLVEGQSVEPLSFREDDCWRDMCNSFNQLRDELVALRTIRADVREQAGVDTAPTPDPQATQFDEDAAEQASQELAVAGER